MAEGEISPGGLVCGWIIQCWFVAECRNCDLYRVFERREYNSTVHSKLQSPLFSVVIPTYNRALLLRQALASVFQQEFQGFEVIVVDDGSTEDLLLVIEEYRDRVTFLRQENAGPSAARNLAISKAVSEYVAFLDSDDLWFPWTLSVYREVIHENNWPAFIAGSPRLFRNPPELAEMERTAIRVLAFRDYLQSGDVWRWFGVSSFVIRRNVLIESGGFSSDMWYGEDADLALRLGTARGFVQVLNPKTFGYRQESNGQLTGQWQPQLPAAKRLLGNERDSKYPGGDERAVERRRIISRHVRPVALTHLRERDFAAAWMLYWKLLPWNLRLGKWKFVFGFVLAAAWHQTIGLVPKASSR